MKPTLRPLLCAPVVFAALTAFGPGRATADTAVEPARAARITELNEAGAKLYGERHYHRAIEKFIEAYALDHDPNLLFNVARCYEGLGDTRAAIEKYTAYLNAPGADASGRLRAERALRALQKQLAARDVPPDAPNANRPTDEASSDGAARPSATRALVAWSALAGGALLVGLGGTSLYLGIRDHDRVTSAPGYGNPAAVDPMTMGEARDLVSSGDNKKLGGAIALGVGGALLATSAALFLLPTEKAAGARPTNPSWALGWGLGAGGFRAAWSVRF